MLESPQRYPNESPGYRTARNELLAAELAARRAVERAAALRRALPPGGEIPEDYLFHAVGADGAMEPVRLSGLFEPGKGTLLLSRSTGRSRTSRKGSAAAVVKSPLERVLPFAAEPTGRRSR